MAIAAVNYPAPVQVNGFSCRNCSEVSLATKGIDPQHPQSEPGKRHGAVGPARYGATVARIAAARHAGEATKPAPVGYSPQGAVSGSVAIGQIVSVDV